MCFINKVIVFKVIGQPRLSAEWQCGIKLLLKAHRRTWISSYSLFSSLKTSHTFVCSAPAPEGLLHAAWPSPPPSPPPLTPEPTAWSTSRYAHNKVGKNWSQPAARPIHHFVSGTQTGFTVSAWRQLFSEAAPLGQSSLDWHKPPAAHGILIIDTLYFYHYIIFHLCFLDEEKRKRRELKRESVPRWRSVPGDPSR